MDSMRGILKQELRRLQEAEKGYLREIAKLPKGSLQEKKIKGIIYPYWVQSRNSKVSYRYLGNLPKLKITNIKEGVALRKKYQNLLKQVKQNKNRIRRILRAKRRAV